MTPVCVVCIKIGLKKRNSELYNYIEMGFSVWWGRFHQSSWNAITHSFSFLQDHLSLQTKFFTGIFARLKLGVFLSKDALSSIYRAATRSSFIWFCLWHRGSGSEVQEGWLLKSGLQMRLLSGTTTCGSCSFLIEFDARHVAEYCGLTSYHHQKWAAASKLAGPMSCFENTNSLAAVVTSAVLVCLALGNC